MENIKVGCVPVRQAINKNTKTFGIRKFMEENKLALIIGGISMFLLSTYTILIMNFINLIKIIY